MSKHKKQSKRARRMKWIVYLMIFIMLLSTITLGLSSIF